MNNYEPLKKFFKNNNWNYEESEELHKCITIKNKDDMWLYNYNDNILVHRNHPVIIKCRGLVLDEEGEVMCYPFDRFFNSFENECSPIDWDSSVILNKIDGSLILVFYNKYKTKWEIITRGAFYPMDNSNENSLNYEELFRAQFNNTEELLKGFTYMFELVTKKNRIVTHYEHEGVYLIGMRNNTTLEEVGQHSLDREAQRIKTLRPETYYARNEDECVALFKTFNDDDEGLVIVDKDFHRMKIKQESYIKLSRIKQLKEQDLFEQVLGISNIDNEYLKKLPEVMTELDNISKKWLDIKSEILFQFHEINNNMSETFDRKEFAKKATKYSFKSVLFNLLDNKDLEYRLPKWEVIKKWV